MKTRTTFLSVLTVSLVVLAFAGCAPGKYIPRQNEELYGEWINEKGTGRLPVAKVVFTASGFKQFNDISESALFNQMTMRIDSKWTDSQGNIWYRLFGTITSGNGSGIKYLDLVKLSKSATVLELVMHGAGKYDTYPTNIDAMDNYSIFYRPGK